MEIKQQLTVVRMLHTQCPGLHFQMYSTPMRATWRKHVTWSKCYGELSNRIVMASRTWTGDKAWSWPYKRADQNILQRNVWAAKHQEHTSVTKTKLYDDYVVVWKKVVGSLLDECLDLDFVHIGCDGMSLFWIIDLLERNTLPLNVYCQEFITIINLLLSSYCIYSTGYMHAESLTPRVELHGYYCQLGETLNIDSGVIGKGLEMCTWW